MFKSRFNIIILLYCEKYNCYLNFLYFENLDNFLAWFKIFAGNCFDYNCHNKGQMMKKDST